jgi:hypothetical protein
MIKALLLWLSKSKKQTVHPWFVYCQQNPHALGCRIYDV